MTRSAAGRKCPRCGARLTVERIDHHLTGQERLFCPRHGEVASLRAPTARERGDAQPDAEEYE